MTGDPGNGGGMAGRLIELIVICIVAGILIQLVIDLVYKLAPFLLIGAVVAGLGALIYQRTRRW